MATWTEWQQTKRPFLIPQPQPSERKLIVGATGRCRIRRGTHSQRRRGVVVRAERDNVSLACATRRLGDHMVRQPGKRKQATTLNRGQGSTHTTLRLGNHVVRQPTERFAGHEAEPRPGGSMPSSWHRYRRVALVRDDASRMARGSA